MLPAPLLRALADRGLQEDLGGGDGTTDLVVPGAAEAPGVIVLMHGPGLDRFIEDRVHELARHGYAAAAPDLYHRQPDDGADAMTRALRLRNDEILADVERQARAEALSQAEGDRVAASALLGLDLSDLDLSGLDLKSTS